MQFETGAEYLARRAREEHARSERAIEPSEYRAHLLLAHEYERRLIAANRRGRFAIGEFEPVGTISPRLAQQH